jgi:hypothetical protein
LVDFRKEAEAHWLYTEGFLNAVFGEEDLSPKTKRIFKFLYTEAMVHGYKHAKEKFDSSNTTGEAKKE